ncbi:hypothetical protein EV421DRAFT_1740023 [Armillaria borealis]|uniref:Uncharacterized protein n=1 Tax=Armillaria borealis TaxID=47425 RepID=A0AA39J426_9AGAR|nr:hypothetical protein EV421DRAFT_1740023 [Armillaria borealis]
MWDSDTGQHIAAAAPAPANIDARAIKRFSRLNLTAAMIWTVYLFPTVASIFCRLWLGLGASDVIRLSGIRMVMDSHGWTLCAIYNFLSSGPEAFSPKIAIDS